MTIRSLEYFLIVVKHLNISRAAHELYISQPALSKQIRLLEEELQVLLFERNNHSMRLTPAGEVLVTEASELLLKHSQLTERVRAAALPRPGTLQVHHMLGALNTRLPDWLLSFRNAFPELSVQLTRSSPGHMFSDLLSHKIQAGFILSASTSCPRPLETAVLHTDHLSLAVPDGHIFASRSTISFSDISNQTLLLLESQDAPFQHSLLPFFLHLNSSQNNNRIRYLKDMETIVAMVRAGSGISFIAKDYCMDIRSLHLIPIQDSVPIQLCLAWNPCYPDKATDAFVKYILHCAGLSRT